MQIKISVLSVSAERLWPVDKPYPTQLRINTSLNIINFKTVEKSSAEAEFIFAANYSPPVAQLRIKGVVKIFGSQDELSSLIEQHKVKKHLPPIFIQPLLNAVLTEAVLLSKIVNAPPPIPFPSLPTTKKDDRGPPPTYVS